MIGLKTGLSDWDNPVFSIGRTVVRATEWIASERKKNWGQRLCLYRDILTDF